MTALVTFISLSFTWINLLKISLQMALVFFWFLLFTRSNLPLTVSLLFHWISLLLLAWNSNSIIDPWMCSLDWLLLLFFVFKNKNYALTGRWVLSFLKLLAPLKIWFWSSLWCLVFNAFHILKVFLICWQCADFVTWSCEMSVFSVLCVHYQKPKERIWTSFEYIISARVPIKLTAKVDTDFQWRSYL